MAEEDSRALARREAAPLDAYERDYMRGDGAILAREKQRAPGLIHAFMGTAIAATVAGAVAGGAWPLLLLAPALGGLWLGMSVLRVNVSERAVNVQYGLLGPKIPIEAIESATVVDYNPVKFGGWGVKRSFDGETIYNMPGDGGRALRLVWRTAKGKPRVTLIGSTQAETLLDAIVRAQKALAAAEAPRALEAGKS